MILRIERHIDIGLENAASTRVIDCTDKIVSPGFISTHNHLYQTRFKGKHANQTLPEYFPCDNFSACLYTVADTFWGQLSGALESLDASTTIVVDHSSVNLSPNNPKTALQAVVTSDFRAIYCYSHPRRVHSWSSFFAEDDIASSWVPPTSRALATNPPHPRVRIGFTINNLFLPAPIPQSLFATLRAAPAPAVLITNHSVGGPAYTDPRTGAAFPSSLQLLEGRGLMGLDVLVSHANFPCSVGEVLGLPSDAELLARSGARVSTTPNTELQMGYPQATLLPGMRYHASLGVDAHSWGGGFMPGQTKMLLQHTRYERSAGLAKEGK